jgi:broad specificity phosphatase PhoE
MSSSQNPPPVELWLVRHGQTDWNLQKRFQGHSDIPLNALGLSQARELAAHLDGSPITAIYSSDLIRARVTAETVAEKYALPVSTDTRLREIDMGDREGRSAEELRAKNPHFWEKSLSLEGERIAPGGESLADVARRVQNFANEIAARHTGQVVMVVLHGLSMGVLRCLAAGLPLTEARDSIPDNCQVVRVNWPSTSPQPVKGMGQLH